MADFVAAEKDRIARLWSKRLRDELRELDLPGRDLRAPLARIVDELARLLDQRGEEAFWLWPESMRGHGAWRYRQRFQSEDVAREMKALQQVLLRVYARHSGRFEPEMVELITELIGEAAASVHAGFDRCLASEEVRFREAAVMESVLENVEVGILLVDGDGTISFATPAVTRILGVPVRALVGTRAAEALRSVLVSVRARKPDGTPFRPAEMPYVRALKERRDVRGVRMTIDRLPDGSEAVLEMSATLLRRQPTPGEEPPAEETSLVGVLQTVADRTEQERSARELTHAYQELREMEARFLERTQGEAIGSLAATAAHALNNALNVLSLKIDRAKREGAAVDALEPAMRGVRETVERLQALSEIRRAADSPVVGPAEPRIERALDRARQELTARAPGTSIERELEGSTPIVADTELLSELVVNVLLAICERVDPGARIRVAGGRRDDRFELRIEAGAKPFSPEELANLAEPLKGRYPNPRRALLLSVGRNQVERMGGTLRWENLPDGRGIGCELRLPVREEELPRIPASGAASGPTPAGRIHRVLVVDDDLENARALSEVLTEEGYDVRTAHTGDGAIRLWGSVRPDAALIDAVMPDRSGWDVAREIRRLTPEAAIAIVTGADLRGQSRQNLALVDAVFRKPVDVGALDQFLGTFGREEPPPSPVIH